MLSLALFQIVLGGCESEVDRCVRVSGACGAEADWQVTCTDLYEKLEQNGCTGVADGLFECLDEAQNACGGCCGDEGVPGCNEEADAFDRCVGGA